MSRNKHPKRLGNHVRKICYLQRVGALPRDAGVHQLDVAHDGWCQHLQGQRCNCTPELRVRWPVLAGTAN
jgi:hypothetical protein